MNIKFGMDNFYVRYLKRFLNTELTQATTILGEFDKNDLNRLITYLNLANVKDMFTVQREMQSKYPELKQSFNIQLGNNFLTWVAKEITQDIATFLLDNLDDIRQYCKDSGWELDDISDWVDLSKDINQDGKVDDADRVILQNIVYKGTIYTPEIMQRADLNLDGVVNEEDLTIFENYLASNKLAFTISQSNRKNYFPNKDMLVFINQFDGTFLYNYAIRDGGEGIDDKPHPNTSGNYKIALYKCKPGQKITIAHNSDKPARLVIGCATSKLKANIPNDFLLNVVDVTLGVADSIEYTCASKGEFIADAQWVCIQCPSNYGDISGSKQVTVTLECGDVNQDGKIDLEDYHLMANYTCIGPGSEELHWKATRKQLAIMDINKDGVVDNADTTAVKDFIDGVYPKPSLGLVSFTYDVPGNPIAGNNVSNLLIIDGHYDKSVNIPFNEFLNNDWVIHEKFFNYLFGIAIHKYSVSENISYLQKLLKEYYSEHSYDPNYFYPGSFKDTMRNLVKDYQKSKRYYTIGDLNRDGKLDNNDLVLLRTYLDTLIGDINGDGYTDKKDYTLLDDYLHGRATLTDEQREKADLDHDGVITLNDLSILAGIVKTAEGFSAIFKQRADINMDGFINELDYELLEKEVNGETDNLKKYDISFILGWCDVQTEAMLETDVNLSENISEVSK